MSVANYSLDRTGWPASRAPSSLEVESFTGRERGNELEDKRLCPVGAPKGVRLQIRTI